MLLLLLLLLPLLSLSLLLLLWRSCVQDVQDDGVLWENYEGGGGEGVWGGGGA